MALLESALFGVDRHAQGWASQRAQRGAPSGRRSRALPRSRRRWQAASPHCPARPRGSRRAGPTSSRPATASAAAARHVGAVVLPFQVGQRRDLVGAREPSGTKDSTARRENTGCVKGPRSEEADIGADVRAVGLEQDAELAEAAAIASDRSRNRTVGSMTSMRLPAVAPRMAISDTSVLPFIAVNSAVLVLVSM